MHVASEKPKNCPYSHFVDNRFVYQFVADMEWCHLVPMHQDGVFKGTGKRAGRPRYKLVPEGVAREIDVPASRCRLVDAKQCVHTSSADQEVFDMPDG